MLPGNRRGPATLTEGWSGLLRLGLRPSGAGERRQSHRRVRAHRGGQLAAGEASLVVSARGRRVTKRIDAELCAFNAEMTGHQDLQPLSVAAWDGRRLLGGLCGSTWGGCGYIELLWVRADYRRRGLGVQLLEAGEGEIRRRGCDQVALSTYSFQAPGFYVRAGYIECGRRSGFPHGQDQILFLKRLS